MGGTGERLRQIRGILDEWNVAHNVKVRVMLTCASCSTSAPPA